jgi:hypothetical protein
MFLHYHSGRRASFALTMAVFLLIACETSTASSPPTTLTIVGGDGQSGTAGAALRHTLVVRVTNEYGSPVPGISVRWGVASGGGSVSPGSGTTANDGRAKAVWTLGAAAGPNVLDAAVAGLSSVTFVATGTPGSPAQLERLTGDGQSGTAGAMLIDTISVRVTDEYGNPVPGISVSWGVVSGGGSVSPSNGTTANDGQARAVWTLGRAAGSNSLDAALAGVSSVTFVATGTPGAPAQLERLAGDGQSGATGATLRDTLVVRVTDEYGNPVQGITVGWGVVSGEGSVTLSNGTTAADGISRAIWTLGAAGWNRVEANLEGLVGGDPVLFTAHGFSRFSEVLVSGTQPPFSTGVAFNRTRSRVALVSERAGLWEFDAEGGAWVQSATSVPGGGRIYAVVHEAAQRLLIISEQQGPSYFDYATGEWKSAVTGEVPAARSFPGIVYDSVNARVLLYGGVVAGGSSNPVGELFAWDGELWTRLTEPPAGRRGGHRMAYNGSTGEIFVHGGTSFGNPFGGIAVQDTWVIRASGEWVRLGSLPSPLSGFGMAYDEIRDVLVVVGGTTVGSGGYGLSDRVWEFVEGNWMLSPVRVPAGRRVFATMIYVPASNGALLYGSEHAGWNDLWFYPSR